MTWQLTFKKKSIFFPIICKPFTLANTMLININIWLNTKHFSSTVRRRISESQLSEITYYPALKIWDVIDESRLFVAIF